MELATFGSERLVTELLAELGLTRSEAAIVADSRAEQSAAELAARIQAAMGESRPLRGPAYVLGQRVRVVLNHRNRTAHAGFIREIVWHYKGQRYNYYLEEDGKKVSQRYFEEDLEPMAPDE